MSTSLSRDQEAALDRGRPIALTAGAGSGKTRVLIERYLRALEDVGFDLDAVLAVTFTRKATAEVLIRVREEVTNRMREDAAHARAWRGVRERLGGAWILTIDAFCHRLLAEMGPAAGLPADRRILTGGALQEVVDEAMRQVIDRVADTPADPDHAALRTLLSVDSRADLVKHLGMLLERRARAAPWARGVLAGPGEDPAWLAREVARIRGVPEPAVGAQDREQHALQTALARLFERLLSRYRELLTAAGGCDFRQLLEDVAHAFRAEPVRRKWARRFRHVLVDEFQDTDPVQWEVIRALFGAGGLERPGLFVVGDEKQAIFSFRDGDVVTFRGAAKEIETAGGAELPLADNYRSAPALVAFSNRLSEVLFGGSREDFEARHSAMKSARDPRTLAGIESRVEVMISRGDRGGQARANELQAIATRIRRFADDATPVYDKAGATVRPATFADQAVLLKARTFLPELEAVLTEHGIPFRVLGGVGFYEQHEVRALCNLMRFLSDDRDDLALLGVLRSALFAIPDSVLLAAVKDAPDSWESLWRKVGRLDARVRAGDATLPTASDARPLADAVDRLGRYRSLADRLPAHELLALAVRESDLMLTLGVVDPSGRAIQNVEKLLDHARRSGGEGRGGLADLERTIARARNATDTPEAQADPPAFGRSAVSVLTVHAAKGLEWPIVFVPGLDSPAVLSGRGELLPPARLRGDGEGGFLHEVRDEGAKGKSALHDFLKELTRRERLAETKRLLYVAATRARDHLVLSAGLVTGEAKGGSNKESWLDWVRPAIDGSVSLIDPAPSEPPPRRTSHPLLSGPPPVPVAIPPRSRKPVEVQLLMFGDEEAKRTAESAAAKDAPTSEPTARATAPWEIVVPATSLARLRACPRRFFLEHVVGVPAEWRDRGGASAAAGVSATVRGSIVHGALEAIPNGVDPVKRVAAVAAGFGVFGKPEVEALEAHVGEAVARFREWPVGRAILEAPAGTVRAEVGCEIGGGGVWGGRGCRVVGAIDLLHQPRSGGAVIVDFKTDAAAGDARAVAARNGYVDQMEAYAAAALAACGDPVTAWLFFTETGEAVPVVGEGGLVSAAESAARVQRTLNELPGIAAAGFPLTTDPEVCGGCPHLGRSCQGALDRRV